MGSCDCGHLEALSAALSTIDPLERQITQLTSQLARATAESEKLHTKSSIASPVAGPRFSDGGCGEKAVFHNNVVYDGPLLELIANDATDADEIIRHLREGASTEETDEVR